MKEKQVGAMEVAAFDVCGTLYAENTTYGFLEHRYGQSVRYRVRSAILLSKLLRAANRLTGMFLRRELCRTLLVRVLKGETRSSLLAEAGAYVSGRLRLRRIEEAQELLRRLRGEGLEVVLVSGSLDFIVEAVAADLQVERYHSTTMEYRDGVCTGRVREDLLYAKRAVLEQTYGLSRLACVVTNNRSDSDIVQAARKSFIVTTPKESGYWKEFFPSARIIRCADD